MKKGYILRGQGIGLVTDRVFENWPSKEDFDAVMKKELEVHGFDPESGEPRPRWVRVQELEIDESKPSDDARAPGEPNEFTYGTLTKDQVEEIRHPHPGRGGEATTMIAVQGFGRVDPPAPEMQTITADDVATIKPEDLEPKG